MGGCSRRDHRRPVTDARESLWQAPGSEELGFSSITLRSLGDRPVLLWWPRGRMAHQLWVMPAQLPGGLTARLEGTEVQKGRQARSAPETWLQPDSAARPGLVDRLRAPRTPPAPTPAANRSLWGLSLILGHCRWLTVAGPRKPPDRCTGHRLHLQNKSTALPTAASPSEPGHTARGAPVPAPQDLPPLCPPPAPATRLPATLSTRDPSAPWLPVSGRSRLTWAGAGPTRPRGCPWDGACDHPDGRGSHGPRVAAAPWNQVLEPAGREAVASARASGSREGGTRRQ
ncbi:ESX-1 secretion-associated protein EspK-like [Mustela erminea]|uniref:ESX-1 secretion-associated protein EspK-like n=1 Tax=Mustela erminea TaxID=36723 RepID=UPI001386CCBD|nr:ESX-1 secretion-associated protein EspK-like [Mustela erminea]